MFRLTDLRVPLLAAPMAGGVSTPALVAAAARAGGLARRRSPWRLSARPSVRWRPPSG